METIRDARGLWEVQRGKDGGETSRVLLEPTVAEIRAQLQDDYQKAVQLVSDTDALAAGDLEAFRPFLVALARHQGGYAAAQAVIRAYERAGTVGVAGEVR